MIKTILRIFVYAAGVMLSFLVLFFIICGMFLTCKKPVKSSYILLEDWAVQGVTEEVLKYTSDNPTDTIFVVRMLNSKESSDITEIDKLQKLKKSRDVYRMYCSGILGFEIPSAKLSDTCTVTIKMRGSCVNHKFPHFGIHSRDRLYSTGFVNAKETNYTFKISKDTTEQFTYIMICYDNDIKTPEGDRNLYVSDVKIDSTDVDLLASDNFFIPSNTELPIYNTLFHRSIKPFFYDRGVDTTMIKYVDVNFDPFNKTLAYAKGTKKYFSKSTVKNINIITKSMHSRRSYLNFKNCLRDKMVVGCIPVKTNEKGMNLYHGMDERVSVFLTWVYWWFH